MAKRFEGGAKEIVQDLTCELTDSELYERAQQLSSTLADIDALETERRNVAKDYADRVKDMVGRSRLLGIAIRHRAETRPVMCIVEFHKPAQGTKRIVRKDTGELVKEEAMSTAEMQENLFEK